MARTTHRSRSGKVKKKVMESGAAPRETCLGCFNLLTATQLTNLNQALAKDPYICNFTSIDSFCESWQRLSNDERLAFYFVPFEGAMENLGIDPNIVSKIYGCLMDSVG